MSTINVQSATAANANKIQIQPFKTQLPAPKDIEDLKNPSRFHKSKVPTPYVLVTKLTSQATRYDIDAKFGKWGTILGVTVDPTRAIIRFESLKAAKKVVQDVHKTNFNGGTINVFFVAPIEEQKAPPGNPRIPKHTIRLSNHLRKVLDVSEEELPKEKDGNLQLSKFPKTVSESIDWHRKRWGGVDQKTCSKETSESKEKEQEDPEEYLKKLSNSLAGHQKNKSFYQFNFSDPRQSLEDIVAKIGPEQTYDCLQIVMDGDSIPCRLYAKVIDRRLALMGMSVIVVFPATVDLLPKIVEYVRLQCRLYVVTVTSMNQTTKTLSVNLRRLLSGVWEDHPDMPLEDAMQMIKLTFASYSVAIPEVTADTVEPITDAKEPDVVAEEPTITDTVAPTPETTDPGEVDPSPETLNPDEDEKIPAPVGFVMPDEIIIVDDISDISSDSEPDWDAIQKIADQKDPTTIGDSGKTPPSTTTTGTPASSSGSTQVARLFHRLADGRPITLEQVNTVISHMLDMRQRMKSGESNIHADGELTRSARFSSDDRSSPPRGRSVDGERPSRRGNDDRRTFKRRNDSSNSPPRRRSDYVSPPRRRYVSPPTRRYDDSERSSRRSNDGELRSSRCSDSDAKKPSKRCVDEFGRDIVRREAFRSKDDPKRPPNDENNVAARFSDRAGGPAGNFAYGLAGQPPAPTSADAGFYRNAQDSRVRLGSSPTLHHSPAAVSAVMPQVLGDPTIQKALDSLTQDSHFLKSLRVTGTAQSSLPMVEQIPGARYQSSYNVGDSTLRQESENVVSEAERRFQEERRMRMLQQLREKELEMEDLLRRRADFTNRMEYMNRIMAEDRVNREDQMDYVGERPIVPRDREFPTPPIKNPRLEEPGFSNEFGDHRYRQQNDLSRQYHA